MRSRSRLFFAMLWVGCVAALGASAAMVEPVPLTPTVGISADYRVEVDGTPVPVGVETSAGRTFHIASFCMSGEVTVRVRPIGDPSTITVHPLRLGVPVNREADAVSFRLSMPRKLLIRADGLDPLVLIATPIEADRPDPNDPKVHYYGPGTHRVGRLRVSSGDTVYLARGARFIGTIEGEEVENVRVLGRGILDGGEDTDWNRRIYGLVFARSRNITVEGIGIRNCYWWTTQFLLCDNVRISHLNIFTFNRNNGGIMTDGCTDFECRDGIFLTRDDCICPHALNAAGNGEPASTYLFEDCVLYNVIDGNALRIGASFETHEVLNWTFNRIDVLERAGAAIYSDHSDWAAVRNLRFIDYHDEVGRNHAIDMKIVKTGYSCQTGYRDERGSFDGLYFVGFRAPGGKIRLAGSDADHGFHDVRFYNCEIGGEPVDDPSDIETNDFVTGLRFITDGSRPEPRIVTAAPPPATRRPDELILDNRSEGFRAVGLEYRDGDATAHNGDYHVAPVPEGFSSFNAAIYKPRIEGLYEVEIHWGDHREVASNAPWTVRHADGYTTRYLDQNESPGWHKHGRYRFDGTSWVRLALPGYFQVTDNPAVADAVRFIRVDEQPEERTAEPPAP